MTMRRSIAGVTATCVVSMALITGCGSGGSHGEAARTSTDPATSGASGRATSTPGDSFSATPFASSVTGTLVADVSGHGPRSLVPLPRAGSLNVIYNCAKGSMTVSRKPDIKATFTCVGGPSVITFGTTKVVNRNPVTVNMTDPKTKWAVQLVLK